MIYVYRTPDGKVVIECDTWQEAAGLGRIVDPEQLGEYEIVVKENIRER